MFSLLMVSPSSKIHSYGKIHKFPDFDMYVIMRAFEANWIDTGSRKRNTHIIVIFRLNPL